MKLYLTFYAYQGEDVIENNESIKFGNYIYPKRTIIL